MIHLQQSGSSSLSILLVTEHGPSDHKSMRQIIAGRQPVMEALKSGVAIEKVVILFGVRGSAIERIRQLAHQVGVPVVEANKQKFRELVEDTTTQGVVAIVATKEYVELDDLLEHARKKNEPPFLLILDELEDPHNVGALIRTAECAGAHGVVLPKHHTAPINHTVTKTSAGASLHLPAAKVTNLAQSIDDLKSKGLWIIGGDSEAEKSYTQQDYAGPLAIVVGNEGKGIRRLIKEKCDFLVKIPLYGEIGSLNASVAGGLILYEVAKARHPV